MREERSHGPTGEAARRDDASCYDYQPVAQIWENRVSGGKLLWVIARTVHLDEAGWLPRHGYRVVELK
ncbi:hypothetical protein [Kamptonema sp. UHCC 0994]|uniref:hypothetical protein n=1 Tax=Kamptonema sp. UHCC 0994 TaxID=3031329 RepID=UPI0023B89E2B|nr:hypothetical protein [Kamptonema sp. UHCC 0994]MDF0555623.1 hypothetical protein [Kamptonema sp. UHCC 0994]